MVNEAHSSSPTEPSAADGIPPADRQRVVFERAQLRGSEVCGLQIRIDRPESWHKRGSMDAVLERVSALCEQVAADSSAHPQVFARAGTDELFVLFDRTPPEIGHDLAREIIAGARQLTIGSTRQHMTISAGLAHNRQKQPIFFETLVEVASRGAEVASLGGGDRFAQTDLYGLVEKRSARTPDAAHERARVRGAYGLALDTSPVFEAADGKALVAPASGEPGAEPTAGPIDPAEAAQTAMALADERRRLRVEFEQATLRELAALEQARSDEHGHEVERLERRITKLANELEQAEQRIAKLSKMKVGDPGVASVYRSVQGLESDDDQFERKREMLETVFISNRQLLEMISERRETRAG